MTNINPEEMMKKYTLTFAVWKHGSGWQPHYYGNHYINAETPEEAATEWADNVMATERPDADSYVEMTVLHGDDVILTKRYVV